MVIRCEGIVVVAVQVSTRRMTVRREGYKKLRNRWIRTTAYEFFGIKQEQILELVRSKRRK